MFMEVSRWAAHEMGAAFFLPTPLQFGGWPPYVPAFSGLGQAHNFPPLFFYAQQETNKRRVWTEEFSCEAFADIDQGI